MMVGETLRLLLTGKVVGQATTVGNLATPDSRESSLNNFWRGS
jgi:hypothetical protein